ncbi:HNH endonuclease [candidate division KSB1 bacterium]|nr:HNH endonuclease [bacterium]NUM66128.1 HNH endonuclease [candidate division KSB1 bacterium]
MAKSLAKIRRRIAAQADYRCGYCLTSEKLTGIRLALDHIIPLAAGGQSEENSLWVACRPCNEFKGALTRAEDPVTKLSVAIFSPRFQDWHEHFEWSVDGIRILGLTPIGRATVIALQLNHESIVYARRQWVKVGWHPPDDI